MQYSRKSSQTNSYNSEDKANRNSRNPLNLNELKEALSLNYSKQETCNIKTKHIKTYSQEISTNKATINSIPIDLTKRSIKTIRRMNFNFNDQVNKIPNNKVSNNSNNKDDLNFKNSIFKERTKFESNNYLFTFNNNKDTSYFSSNSKNIDFKKLIQINNENQTSNKLLSKKESFNYFDPKRGKSSGNLTIAKTFNYSLDNDLPNQKYSNIVYKSQSTSSLSEIILSKSADLMDKRKASIYDTKLSLQLKRLKILNTNFQTENYDSFNSQMRGGKINLELKSLININNSNNNKNLMKNSKNEEANLDSFNKIKILKLQAFIRGHIYRLSFMKSKNRNFKSKIEKFKFFNKHISKLTKKEKQNKDLDLKILFNLWNYKVKNVELKFKMHYSGLKTLKFLISNNFILLQLKNNFLKRLYSIKTNNLDNCKHLDSTNHLKSSFKLKSPFKNSNYTAKSLNNKKTIFESFLENCFLLQQAKSMKYYFDKWNNIFKDSKRVKRQLSKYSIAFKIIKNNILKAVKLNTFKLLFSSKIKILNKLKFIIKDKASFYLIKTVKESFLKWKNTFKSFNALENLIKCFYLKNKKIKNLKFKEDLKLAAFAVKNFKEKNKRILKSFKNNLIKIKFLNLKLKKFKLKFLLLVRNRIQENESKLKSALFLWAAKFKFEKANESAIVIQKFLKLKLNELKIKAKRNELNNEVTLRNNSNQNNNANESKNENRKDRLLKLTSKLSNKNLKIIQVYFKKWKRQSVLIEINNSALKIQNFLNLNLNKKLLKSKDKSFLNFRKGLDTLEHYFVILNLNFAFQKIKTEFKRRILIKFFLSIKNKKAKNLKVSFFKLKFYSLFLFHRKKMLVKKIQIQFRKLKLKAFLIKKSKLNKFLFKKIKALYFDLDNLIYFKFKHWFNVTLNLNKLEASNVIKNYLKRKLEKIKLKDYLFAFKSLKFLFLNFLKFVKIKLFLKSFILSEKFKRFKLKLIKFKFKDFIFNLKQKIKFESLSLLCFNLSKILKIKKLKIFKKLKNFAEKIKETKAAIKIQKNYFKFKFKALNSKISNSISNLVFKLIKNKKAILNFYFIKWSSYNLNLKILKSKKVIFDFIKNNFKIKKAKFKLFSLFKLFFKQILIKDSLRLFAINFNFNFKLLKFNALMERICKKKFFYKLKKQKEENLKLENLKVLYYHLNKKQTEKSLNFNFNLWQIKNKKLKLRNLSLKYFFKKIQKNFQNFQLKNFFQILKLNVFIKNTENFFKLKIFKKFKIFSLKINKLLKLKSSKDLNDNYLFELNLNHFKIKLFELFVFKTLKIFLDKINSLFLSNSNLLKFKKMFINNLNLIKESLSLYKYCNKLKGSYKRKIKSKEYKYSEKSKKSKLSEIFKIFNTKTRIYYHSTPILLKAINVLKNFNLKFAFDNLKFAQTKNLLKNKLIFLIKRHLWNAFLNQLTIKVNLFNNNEMKVNSLFKLLKVNYLLKLKTEIKEFNKINKLIYLLKVTFMHKSIIKNKFLTNIFKKWLFNAKLNKLTREKVSMLYKNMHLSYLNMVQELSAYEYIQSFQKFSVYDDYSNNNN